jgi:hypothetical protein
VIAVCRTAACLCSPGCGFMIHHNQDSERHEVFGVKEFNNSINKKSTMTA